MGEQRVEGSTGIRYEVDDAGCVIDIRPPAQFNLTTAYLEHNLAEGRGERPALRFGETTFTFRGLADLACRTANAFRSLDLRMEQRVLIMLPDVPELMAGWLGAMRLGAVPVIAHMFYPRDACLHMLRDSRARVLLTTPEKAEALDLRREDLPFLDHVVCTGGRWEDVVAGQAPVCPPAATHRDDMAYWLWTSGTTGTPRAAVHLHHDLLWCDLATKNCLMLRPDDIVLSVPKFSFAYGMQVLVGSPMRVGASSILDPERFSPQHTFEMIERCRPTVFVAVPTAYAALLNASRQLDPDLSSIRLCLSAGEPLPAPLFERWRELTGLEILDGIGTTETAVLMIHNHPGRARPGTTGEVIRGIHVRLLDEAGGDVPVGELGDLWVRVGSTVPYYWHGHEASQAKIRGEWFVSGDKFFRDADGYYTYAGRSDDMFKSSAQWVSPTEVEAVIMQHPAVLECAVVSRPDADGILRPMAYVVLRPQIEPGQVDGGQLIEHCGQRLAGYKRPRWVQFVTDLPKTPSGKIQRFQLRRRALQN